MLVQLQDPAASLSIQIQGPTGSLLVQIPDPTASLSVQKQGPTG